MFISKIKTREAEYTLKTPMQQTKYRKDRGMINIFK